VIAIGLVDCGGSGNGSEATALAGPAIISIGDSVASGEGNPETVRHRWDEPRCHRSSAAGQTIAGQNAANANGMIFYSFACSGATIPIGLLGPYKGIAPNPFLGSLPPQVNDAAHVKAVTNGGIAAILVSVGANDIGFSKIVEFCMFQPHCESQHFSPKLPPVFEAPADRPTLQQWVNDRRDALPAAYGRLATALRPLVDPDRVIIVTYFDPTTGAQGVSCSYAGVRPDESAWARQHVLVPLNQEIVAAAQQYGWKVVPGVAAAFRTHGVCRQPRSERWVNLIGNGPLTGIFHPNEEGHRQIAALTAPVLDQVLNP
jgi:hypothetical protein